MARVCPKRERLPSNGAIQTDPAVHIPGLPQRCCAGSVQIAFERNSDGMRRPVSETGCDKLPKEAPEARKRRPAVKKISTAKIKSQAAKKKVTIGIDLGDRSSRYCLLDEEGVVIGEASTPTTKATIAKVFGTMARCRIALEAGGHSPWVSRLLESYGHEVIVANPRNVRLIGESTRKDDRLDARTLARLARIDPMLLSPVRHRGAEAQADLAVIRARRVLVKARTMLINAARGLTKSFGERLRKCGAGQV